MLWSINNNNFVIENKQSQKTPQTNPLSKRFLTSAVPDAKSGSHAAEHHVCAEPQSL